MLFDPLQGFTGLPRGGTRPVSGPQFAQALGLTTRTA